MKDNITEQLITVIVYKNGKPIGEVQGKINVKTSKITIPKGATYLDIDRLFNIKSNRSHEKEILLDKNAQYLIEDVDTTTNEVCLRMLIE